jgi:hypothetical protein
MESNARSLVRSVFTANDAGRARSHIQENRSIVNHMGEDMERGTSFLMGLGVGIGLGAILMSRPVAKFRDAVTEKAEEALEPLAAAGHQIGDVVKDAISSGKAPELAEVIGTVKDAYEGTIAWREETEDVKKLAS